MLYWLTPRAYGYMIANEGFIMELVSKLDYIVGELAAAYLCQP